MAIWTNHREIKHEAQVTMRLLKGALISALEDVLFFENTSCRKPDLQGAGHAEIAARLGRYRDACNSFREREALMLTKVVQARKWAAALKKLSPVMADDVTQFLDATEECVDYQAQFGRDAQRMFNGGASYSRFIAQRKGEEVSAAEAPEALTTSQTYFVGGRTALNELKAACEVFLSQIEDEMPNGHPARAQADPNPATFLPFLEAEEPALDQPIEQPVH